MSAWLPGLVGVVGGLCLGVIWLIALSVLIQRRNIRAQSRTAPEPGPDGLPSGPHSSATLEPIRSFLEPDEDEPFTPLPSESSAPLSFNRYVEVRGAISGWSDAGLDIEAQLGAVFGLERRSYDEAHAWWMMALEGADDRLREIERRAAVFAERYGGAAG